MNNKDVVKVSIEFADGTIAVVFAATPEPVASAAPADKPATPEATATDTPADVAPAV